MLTKQTILRRAVAGVLIAALFAACGPRTGPVPSPDLSPKTASPSPTHPVDTSPASRAPSPTAKAMAAASPTTLPTFGFFFSPTEVLTFYREQESFTCEPKQPAEYVGFDKTVCSKVLGNVVERVTLITTEKTGALAGGWASVVDINGSEVAPADAVIHLGSFVAELLGPINGEPVARWLGEHLGAGYEDMAISTDLTAATYIGQGDDASQLFIEIESAAYLTAPKRAK